MLGNVFTGWHLIIILAVVLLLFGAAKLPGLAKAIGQSARILRTETREREATTAPAEEIVAEQDAPPQGGARPPMPAQAPTIPKG